MRSRLILGAVLVALCVVVIMVLRSRTRPPSPPTATTGLQTAPPSPQITQQQLETDIIQHGVTPDRAKMLFSMVVGRLPGVSVPATRDRGDFDGTLAVTYLNQVWSSLTPEQQTAATALVAGPRRAPSQQALNPSHLLPAAFLLFAPDTPAFDYTTLAKNADGTLAAFLQVPGVAFDTDVDYGTPEGTEYAHTWSWTWGSALGLTKAGCHMTFWNQMFAGLSQDEAEAVVTHEMFHCFQQRAVQTPSVLNSIHPWILEGEATWAMSEVMPSVQNTGILAGKWNLYVFGPLTFYALRSYDALGVYGHLEDTIGAQGVWPRLLPVVLAGANHDDEGAFQLLVQGTASTYYTSWGSSYFEAAGHAPWVMLNPGSPPKSGPAPASITVDSGSIEALPTVGPAESALVQVSGGADIVGVYLYTGYGRLHDQGFAVDTALVNSAPLKLCLKQGGCACPDGSPGASQFTQAAIAPLFIGINGGDITTMGGVGGESLDKFCKQPQQPKPPTPPPGGGGGGGGGGGSAPPDNKPPPPGSSTGDVHLTTFDGLTYDFQTVGEYTLVRSTKDDFSVQVRQAPVPGSRMASVNQAMAATMGGQRVTVTMENNKPVLRMDGQPVTGALPRLRAGSLTSASTAFGDSYQLTWPDGTEVHIEQLGRYALNVTVKPAAARRGALEGLLGNDDGVPSNDLLGTNQREVKPESDDVNHALADAWRVVQAKSSFDYQPGQSTGTFTNPDFPLKGAAPPVENRAQAEKVCRESGITDPHLLADCVLDLAVTNNFVFGSQYAQAQQVLAAKAALAKPTAPMAAAVSAALRMNGEILDHTSEPEFHFSAGQGDVLWIHDPDCTDHAGEAHPVFLMLYDPTGKMVRGGMGCQFGRQELPVAGQYTLRARFHYPNEIVRYSIPIRFVRHTRRQTIAYGQAVSGNIEEVAAQDVYTFNGQAGDVVLLSGQGCELGGLGTEFLDAQGHDFLAPNCRNGTVYTLPQSGPWQLLINSENWATGSYHFVLQGGKPETR